MYGLRLAVGDAVIEGVLVPFGEPGDSYGTTFDAQTDFCLDWLQERPLLYQHGVGDAGTTPVGKIVSVTRTAAGLLMRATLDKASPFYQRIRREVGENLLRLSSGAMEHLVDVSPWGRVRRWPLVEGSLTKTPSSARTPITAAQLRAHCRAAGIELDEHALLRREVDGLRRFALDMELADVQLWATRWGIWA